MTDDELRRMIREAVEAILDAPGMKWTGAQATRDLEQTIKNFNEVVTRQTGWLVALT